MRGAVLIVLLWLGSCAQARADNFTVTVDTFPPGAALHDQFGGFLGLGGQPFALTWDRSRGVLQMRVSLAGHETATYTVTPRELQKGRYPAQGQLTLEPSNLRVALMDQLRYRTGLVVSLLAGLGVAIFVGRRALRKGEMEVTAAPQPMVDGYRLLEPIGRGGMSEVYKAQRGNGSSEEFVALKLMHVEMGQDPEAAERFRREIKTHLALSHPHLPALHDWGEHDDGRLYLVMELLDGETLKQRLARTPILPDDEVARILQQLGEALAFLHDKGFVHRDIKPSNVFCCGNGQVKLMDMGVAQGHELAPLTRTGMAVGTPHYMAPEQTRGLVTAKSDQYGLGVMAFEMLAGRRPFAAADVESLLRMQVSQSPPPLADFRPQAPPKLQEAIHRILSKNPNGRYPDIASAVQALRSGLVADCSDDTVA